MASQTTITRAPGTALAGDIGGEVQSSSAKEIRDTRRIVEDIQRKTIEHTYRILGHPDEALLDVGLMGMDIGDPHPAGISENSTIAARFGSMFVVRREFRKLSDITDAGKRWSECRVTYQKRTCPLSFEQTFDAVLVAVPNWFALTGPWSHYEGTRLVPDTLNGVNPIPLLMPQFTLTRRWPHIKALESTIRLAERHMGERNDEEFLGYPRGTWLCERVRAERLYGPGDGRESEDPTNEAWDVSITFRGDPFRQHNWWAAIKDASGNLIGPDPSVTDYLEAMRRVHVIRELYPIYPGTDFNVLFDYNHARCGNTSATP
mgnify:CR=1 FL=1